MTSQSLAVLASWEMKANGSKPLTMAEFRATLNVASRKRFGMPADRLPRRLLSGATAESATARRLAFAAHYAKKK